MIFFKDVEVKVEIESELNITEEEKSDQARSTLILNKVLTEMKNEFFKLFDHQRNILQMLDNYQKESLLISLHSLINSIEQYQVEQTSQLDDQEQVSSKKLQKQKQMFFKKLIDIQMESGQVYVEGFISSNLMSCLYNYQLIQTDEFKKTYSRFDVKETIKKVISVLKSE